MAWIRKALPYPATPHEPEAVDLLRDAFISSVNKALRDDPDFAFPRLADLLGEAGDYPLDVIVDLFPFDVFEGLYPDALRAVQSQLEDTGRRANARLGWPFDDLDLNAVFWARNNAGRLITSLTDSQRRSLNSLLLRRTINRSSVDQIAAELRQVVGLHPLWSRAVTNYHQKLLDDGVDPAFARKQADKYRDRLVNSRAWTIARTEVMRATNMGQVIGWNQAITLGNLAPDSLMKWVTAKGHPNPPCPVCRQLDGKTVNISGGEFWTTTHLVSGAPRFHACSAPPIHPACRCSLVMVKPPKSRSYGGVDLADITAQVAALQSSQAPRSRTKTVTRSSRRPTSPPRPLGSKSRGGRR